MSSSIEKPTFGEKVKRKTKKVGIIIGLTVLFIGIVIFSFLYWGKYGNENIRAGKVIYLNKEGTIFKTYEGRLHSETGILVEPFDFSVAGNKEDIIQELNAAVLSGERVTLHYIERYTTFPWRGNTKYFVVRVERTEKTDTGDNGSVTIDSLINN